MADNNSESPDCPLISKQPLNSGHLLLNITDSFHSPDCMQTILYDPDLADNCRLFGKNMLCCIAQLNIRLVLLLAVLTCLAFLANLQQSKSLKTQPRCAQQPDYALACLPERYWKPLS